MKIKSKYIFNIFLSFYLIFGIYLSVKTGLTTDELPNQYIWTLNLEAIKDFFGYNDTGYSNLYEYVWRYKGVGFYYFSHVYLLIVDIFIKLEEFPDEISKALLNHGLIFLTFFLSGIFSKKIVNFLIKEKFYSNIFLIYY